jgi:hypothetical protein
MRKKARLNEEMNASSSCVVIYPYASHPCTLLTKANSKQQLQTQARSAPNILDADYSLTG